MLYKIGVTCVPNGHYVNTLIQLFHHSADRVMISGQCSHAIWHARNIIIKSYLRILEYSYVFALKKNIRKQGTSGTIR